MLLAQPSPFFRHARAQAPAFLAVGLAALMQAGCYFTDEGLSPPERALYFPTGLAVSPGGSALYVANSDFDLQYNGGTVQVLDLVSTRATLSTMLDGIRCVQGTAAACAAYGATPTSVDQVCAALAVGDGGARLERNTNLILTPSACTAIAPPYAARGATPAAEGTTFATVGAFASGAIVAESPDRSQARLFVPVRGDPSITWFDIVPDGDGLGDGEDLAKLDCGQATTEGNRCNDEHRIGLSPYDNFRSATIPVEPVGLDISDQMSPSGDVPLLSTHQITGGPAVGLSVNYWTDVRPSYQFTLSSGVPEGPMAVAHVPRAAFVREAGLTYQPGFLVSYSATAEVDLYRYDDDRLASPRRPFVTRAAVAGIAANAGGTDSRGIAVDDSARRACEEGCAGALACLRECVATPLDFFVANRTPPSLLYGKLRTTISETEGAPTSAFDKPEIIGTVSLATGPSNVARGTIIGPDGKCQTRIFAVTFESRLVFGYDPVAQRVDTIIRTGRGPHALAFDTAGCGTENPRSHLYVGHFTDSYLGAVDLDMRHPETYGVMFASIGTPVAPRGTK